MNKEENPYPNIFNRGWINGDRKYISPLHELSEKANKAEKEFMDNYKNLKINYVEKYGEEVADKKLEKHKKYGDYHRELKRQHQEREEELIRKRKEEEEEHNKYIKMETWDDFVKYFEQYKEPGEQLRYLKYVLKILKQRLVDNEDDQKINSWIKKLKIEISYKEELLAIREGTPPKTRNKGCPLTMTKKQFCHLMAQWSTNDFKLVDKETSENSDAIYENYMNNPREKVKEQIDTKINWIGHWGPYQCSFDYLKKKGLISKRERHGVFFRDYLLFHGEKKSNKEVADGCRRNISTEDLGPELIRAIENIINLS
ncbi:MAG: hypothetical protein JXQ30_13805 [Spirochaetes bacterium]|nr:hypothetical protein [Spirochaetota bacterium]